MIIAEMGGGLGNQMNCYSCAKALSIHNKIPLKVDITYYDTLPRYRPPRHYDLDKFKTTSKPATRREITKHILKTRSRHLNKILAKSRIFERSVYRGSDFNLKTFFNIGEDIYLAFYGDFRYFDPIKSNLMKEFLLKEEYKKKINPLLKKISEENSVSIHVRRGDLIRLGAIVLPAEYYKKAIETINKKVKNPKFYVFSDDIEWCKKNLKCLSVKLNFIQKTEVYEDFELMKNCKHNILANSALSWWAGYLNPNLKKIVIAPEHFSHFRSEKPVNESLPKKWIKI